MSTSKGIFATEDDKDGAGANIDAPAWGTEAIVDELAQGSMRGGPENLDSVGRPDKSRSAVQATTASGMGSKDMASGVRRSRAVCVFRVLKKSM